MKKVEGYVTSIFRLLPIVNGSNAIDNCILQNNSIRKLSCLHQQLIILSKFFYVLTTERSVVAGENIISR